MPFLIIRNDITKMNTDAIVNTANPKPVVGTGLDKAIYQKAGWDELLMARKKICVLEVGEVAITPAFALDAKYIIHTAGPIWQGGKHDEENLLRACYKNALSLAQEKKCKSIAMPLISTGNYGFPKERAFKIAVDAIKAFLLENEMLVYLVVFDKDSAHVSQKLFADVKSYVDEKYVKSSLEEEYCYEKSERTNFSVRSFDRSIKSYSAKTYSLPTGTLACNKAVERKLEDLLANLDDTFSEALLKWIDTKNLSDPEVYKRANVDRKLFSKIKNNKNYKPSKNTAIAFALALELNLDETKDLIGRAGYTLNRCYKFDVIVEYFIRNKNYDIMELNEVLFAFEEQLIGA